MITKKNEEKMWLNDVEKLRKYEGQVVIRTTESSEGVYNFIERYHCGLINSNHGDPIFCYFNDLEVPPSPAFSLENLLINKDKIEWLPISMAGFWRTEDYDMGLAGTMHCKLIKKYNLENEKK